MAGRGTTATLALERAKGTFTLLVLPAHLANTFKDAMLPEVFATPMMITAMENAALNAIREYLERGESAVGTAVDIRHLAATPVGHQVTAQAEVTGVDGRRITARHDAGIPAADIAEQGERLADKFDALVEPMLGAPRTRELREVISGLDNVADIGSLARLATR